MRIAFISDVHGDLHALRDALAQAERLRCDAVVCAGDLVDGPFPEETIALVRARGIPCVRGNHDRWAVARGGTAGSCAASPSTGNGPAPRLSVQALEFLAALPVAWDAKLGGVRVAVRHGTPRSDMDGVYPENARGSDVDRWLAEARADVLVVGHTHAAFVLRGLGGGLVVNPGALCRGPVESGSRAASHGSDERADASGPAPAGGTFGVLELPEGRFTLHRASDGEEEEVVVVSAGVSDRRGGRDR